MLCTKCGNEIPDDSLFCSYCGEITHKADYPEIRKISDDNEVFNCVYYGPDYYDNRSLNEEANKDGGEKRGLRRMISGLSHKKNKS
jgi:hypothetical protein